MKIHVLQHVPYEGAANILVWAQRKGADITTTRFYEAGWALPESGGIDLLVVMGGPMGTYDEAKFPWLVREKIFIKDCIAAGKLVLGVCLGAQLAAEALGAKVYPNPEREIGWFPVQRTPVTCPVLLDMPPSIMAFHWHGDTFDLPPGALHLAYSEACANQAFIWRNQVLGLQFHIELSASDVESVLDNVWNDPSRVSAYVQNDEHIREGLGYADLLQPLLEGILFRFAG